MLCCYMLQHTIVAFLCKLGKYNQITEVYSVYLVLDLDWKCEMVHLKEY